MAKVILLFNIRVIWHGKVGRHRLSKFSRCVARKGVFRSIYHWLAVLHAREAKLNNIAFEYDVLKCKLLSIKF